MGLLTKLSVGISTLVCSACIAAATAEPWSDACNYPNVVPTELQAQVGNLLGATVLLLPVSHLIDVGDKYFLGYFGYLTNTRAGGLGGSSPMCPGSVFYDAFSADVNNGRTGFLVGPDLIATAPHLGFAGDPNRTLPSSFAVIFGFNGGGLGSGCSFDQSGYVAKSQVAFAVNGGTYVNMYDQGTDMAIWQIVGAPAGHPWLRLRSRGAPTMDEVFASAGSPFSLFTKFQYGITYTGLVGPGDGVIDPNLPDFFNYEVMDGSSGTPFYNLDKGFVESIAAFGDGIESGDEPWNGGTCAWYESEYDPNPPFAPITPGLPIPSYVNTGVVENLATPAPSNPNIWVTPEPRLSSIDDVTYVLPVGGSSPPGTQYSLQTSLAGPQTVLTAISVLPPPAGQPALLLNGTNLPYTSNLGGPGASLPFSVTTSIPPTLACGTYDRYLQVETVPDGQPFTDTIRHRFEVGLKEVSVSPTDLWQAYFLSSPYPTRTYTITNVRPTATDISVNPGVYGSSMGLLTINGGSGQEFHLEPGAHVNIVVGINSSADTLPIGAVYHGFVSINQLDATCGKPPIFVNVDFKRGEQTFVSSTGQTLLPSPTQGNTYGTPVDFGFDLSAVGHYCVGDVNLDLCLATAQNIQSVPSLIKIQMTSPSGRVGTLWDREGGNSNYLLQDTLCTNPNFPLETTFHLDDATTPPLGPQELSYFNSLRITGQWHLDVSSATGTPIFAGPARLDFTRANLCAN